MWRLFFLLLFPVTVSGQLKRFQFPQNKMGAPFNIIFYHTDSLEAVRLSKECYSIVDSLDYIFSDYSSTSEVAKLSFQSNLNHLKVSDELYEMIVLSKHAWKRSGKAFDVAIGALTRLWRQAKVEKRFPSKEEINQVMKYTGLQHVANDDLTKTISFRKQGIRFDFGGIVPGYVAQRVIDHLTSKNIRHALADASGDIVVSEPPPGKKGWTVAINLPQENEELWDKYLELSNCAVSTSGDLYRFIIHNGKKYSHIIDPRTGYGVTSQRNVTVIAKDGATADWLATACSVLPIKKALRLVKKEKAELLIAVLKDEEIITYKSKNFDSYFEEKER
ncbi:MAG TPA: FAD:protein FMN transferase [Chitinophagaceae bacterium]|nr:FAD:protein FMN transferase [Chitinophagaceae bacterium]